MAFGITAYSEAAFSSEANSVIAYATSLSLTSSIGEESNTGSANVTVSGIELSSNIGTSVAGTSALVGATGSQLTSSIGSDSIIDIGVPVTGSELSVSNKTFTQDTLTAFGQAPFATQSPSTIEIPTVTIEGTTGAGTLPSFLLQSTLGTFSVAADGNVSVVVTEHTMNTSIGSVSVTGIANVSVTGSEITMTLGEESAFTDHTVAVTGMSLTSSIGEEVPTADANVTLSGMSLTSSIGTASQSSIYNVTGSQMASSIGSVTVTASASATISSGTSCNIGANFTQFNTFANGEYTARGFKFKVELTSNDPAQNINVTELGYEASLKRRTETVNSSIASQCATTGSAKTVTFADPFFTGTGSLGGSTTAFLPTVGITLEGASSGDFFNITSITGTQFVIETRSSSGLKDLNFKYTAIGFGKGG